MTRFELVEPGTIALMQQSETGRIMQVALTPEQSGMLQKFLSIISAQSPLIRMGEEHDLILKRNVCKRCKNK